MKISIITINYNNLKGLKETVESVFSQTYQSINYIVIDGASTDGSKEYIKEHEEQIDFWISEPDQGIYDAMNKGIDHMVGNYVVFMNSGDKFHSTDVLEKIVPQLQGKDVVYGNARFTYSSGKTEFKKMPRVIDDATFFERTLNHQCIFYESSWFRDGLRYDLDYKILADWALTSTILIVNKGTYKRVDLCIVDYDAEGVSASPENQEQMQADRMLFYTRHSELIINKLIDSYKRDAIDYRKCKNSRFLRIMMSLQQKYSALRG